MLVKLLVSNQQHNWLINIFMNTISLCTCYSDWNTLISLCPNVWYTFTEKHYSRYSHCNCEKHDRITYCQIIIMCLPYGESCQEQDNILNNFYIRHSYYSECYTMEYNTVTLSQKWVTIYNTVMDTSFELYKASTLISNNKPLLNYSLIYVIKAQEFSQEGANEKILCLP